MTVSCVDPATDLKFFTSGGSACASLTITGSGADYLIDGSCMQQGNPVRIHEALTYSGKQRVTLRATLGSASGPVTVSSELQCQGGSPCPVAGG